MKVWSFSFKKGIPEDYTGNGGGYVFDCRSTNNPGRYDRYKQLTGLDAPVIKFLEDDGEIVRYLDHIYSIVEPHVNRYLERGNIEVAPLAYMRGRTLDDSFIILDEAQNTTREQMKMFLTRLGFGSKIVITGDVTQIDLPGDKVSGLKEAIRVLDGVEDIQICKLTASDVVRHVLVQRIVAAYDAYEKTRPPEQPRKFIKRNSR